MNNLIHELWLIYEELKDMDTGDSVHLAHRLGAVINQLNRLTPAALGAKGGSAKTEAKREAARDNGAKGGRPVYLCCDCAEPIANEDLVQLAVLVPHDKICKCGREAAFRRR